MDPMNWPGNRFNDTFADNSAGKEETGFKQTRN